MHKTQQTLEMDLVILCYARIPAINQSSVSSEFSLLVHIVIGKKHVAELVSLEMLSSVGSWKTVLGDFSTFFSVYRRQDSVVYLRSGLPGL